METAVPELVDRTQREGAEVVELADATEVEDGVPPDHALDPPQKRAEGDACEEHRPAPGQPLVARAP